jgi:pyruvyltransferase
MRRYPIVYFDSVANVGDQINPYLIRKITNRRPYNVKSKLVRHLVGLGSMFHMANKRSIIWGTGIISNLPSFSSKIDYYEVLAVRGELTKDVLLNSPKGVKNDIALGDPGLLLPIFYHPSVKKKRKIGLVPHYVDACNPYIRSSDEVYVIDVSLDPESFVDELLSCEVILSSSLHGLILADAYGIPNKWVFFSDKVTGGYFKYQDYYSTTDAKNEDFVFIDSGSRLEHLVSKIEDFVSVKRYLFDLNSLLRAFPK